MTVGDFVLINTYMLQVVRPVEMLGYAMQGLSQGVAMLKKMLELFGEEPESREPPATFASPFQRRAVRETDLLQGAGESGDIVRGKLSANSGELEFANVSLSYDSERPVLCNVTFRVPAGKTLGIVGTSGSGKSTIVRLLVRLYEPDSGRILLDGVPLSELPLQEVRRSISVVPQDTVLFNETIDYNIGFGKEQGTRAEVEQAAKLAHLHDFILTLPDRYETRVGERGVKLSGGEKQRVSIARAVIKQPKIFVFDEATSSLDSRTERDILRNLRDISRLSTTIVIAHRLSAVVHADEIILLEAGSIVERGSHDSLIRQKGRYALLWMAQQGGTVAA
jgi:ATP-binding cassette subfamily B protein